MTAIDVPFTLDQKELIEWRAKEEGYATAGDYLAAMALEKEKRQAWAEIEALVVEGLNSGPAVPLTEADWQRLRSRIERIEQQANHAAADHSP